MIIVKFVLLILSILTMFAGAIMLIKNNITYRNHTIIDDAIFAYRMDMINKAVENKTIMDGVKYEVGFDDTEDYNETLLRIFDWGYKNILPKDKFEIIKPYIHK